MKALSCLASFTIAICAVAFVDLPASATAANITGRWEVTIHYPAPDGDYLATYVLKQDREGLFGHEDARHGDGYQPRKWSAEKKK